MVVVRLFILTCFFHLSRQRHWVNYKKYELYTAARVIPAKLAEAMGQYNQDARVRVHEMNEMRFMYEESPHYEMGYLMSEIVDRYRRMVTHVKRPMEHQSDNVFATLRKTELIQALYMEIYHLVHMLHEIQRKYRYMPEFSNLDEEMDLETMQDLARIMQEKEKLQKREEKKKRKVMKKMRELAMAQGQKANYPPKNRNKWWPIDYGWEIDYYW